MSLLSRGNVRTLLPSKNSLPSKNGVGELTPAVEGEDLFGLVFIEASSRQEAIDKAGKGAVFYYLFEMAPGDRILPRTRSAHNLGGCYYENVPDGKLVLGRQ